MKAYQFDEDTVITSDSLDEAKCWYCEEVGDYPTDITELNPKIDAIFSTVKNNGLTLLPVLETGLHQFTVIDGEVYEKITIEEAWINDGSPSGIYIVASSQY